MPSVLTLGTCSSLEGLSGLRGLGVFSQELGPRMHPDAMFSQVPSFHSGHLSPAGVTVCQRRVEGLHSFPWLFGASLGGRRWLCSGFPSPWAPHCPQWLVEGLFFGFAGGDSWDMACSGGETRLSLKGQNPGAGWRGEMQPWRCRGWQRDIVVGPDDPGSWPPRPARERCLKGHGASQVLKAGVWGSSGGREHVLPHRGVSLGPLWGQGPSAPGGEGQEAGGAAQL